MNTALELTMDILSTTTNGAADQLLSLAIAEDPSLRRPAIAAMLRRKSKVGPQHVLKIWNSLSDDEVRAVQEYPVAMQSAVEETLRGKAGTEEWYSALDALRMLSLAGLLPMLIELIEACGELELRNRMLATVLELGSALGESARQGREQASVRQPIVRRLADSVRRADYHRCQGLCEAFLVASVWGDRDLRMLLQDDHQAARRLAGLLETSSLPGIMKLVAGYIRRRNIPPVVRQAIEIRSDHSFRESLFSFVSSEPNRMALKNLANLKPLELLRDWRDLGAVTSLGNHPGLLYAHTLNSGDATSQLTVILDVLARSSRRADVAVSFALSRCQRMAEWEWLQAAIALTNSDFPAVQGNPAAQLLWRMVQFLDHPDAAVVEGIRDVLRPLHTDSLLKEIDLIPATNFQRLGGLVKRIDPRTVEVLRDELRCPVMERRMRAIKLARACEVVSEVEGLLAHAAIHDHREARLVAIDTLSLGSSSETFEALQQVADGPVGALRDAALDALEVRRRRAGSLVTEFPTA